MTNKRLCQLLTEARYTMPPSDQAEFRHSLNKLKKIRPQSRRERMISQVVLAAVAVLLLTFTMPSLVRAVGAWVDQVFKSRLDEVVEYQEMSDEEKLSQMTDLLDSKPLMAIPVSATGDFQGVGMQISNFMVQEIPLEAGATETILFLELQYSDFPSFDPNWIDFSLTAGGQECENRRDLSEYRNLGTRITDAAGWRDVDFDWFGSSRIIEGIPMTSMNFSIPASALAEKGDMILTGRIDGQEFSLTIPFDPDKLVVAWDPKEQAKESLESMDQHMAEKKDAYEELNRQAIALGIDGVFLGKTYQFSEIAFVDDMMYVSIEYAGESLDLDAVVVDGYSMTYSDYYDFEENNDGSVSIIIPKYNPYATDTPPEESLFTMQLGAYSEEMEFVFVERAFRYHWATQKVTLPADAAQEAAWVKESRTLQNAIEAEHPRSQTYDISDKELSKTIDGLRVKLTDLHSDGELLYVDFDLKYDKPTKGLRVLLEEQGMNSQINGQPAMLYNSGEENGVPDSLSLVIPVHFSKFVDGTKIRIDIPLTIFDLKDEVVFEEVFTFEFSL